MWHGGQEIWSGSGREFDDLFGTEYSVQLGHCPTVTVLPTETSTETGNIQFSCPFLWILSLLRTGLVF